MQTRRISDLSILQIELVRISDWSVKDFTDSR